MIPEYFATWTQPGVRPEPFSPDMFSRDWRERLPEDDPDHVPAGSPRRKSAAEELDELSKTVIRLAREVPLEVDRD